MYILGLTGSIGMGKSVCATMFRRLRVPVHDADATVHALMSEHGQAVAPIERTFPGVVKNGAVDRQSLGAEVFGNADALKRLESILHPMVRQAEKRFLAIQSRHSVGLVVLDIPLLFETGGQRRCDGVACVSAPLWLQKKRVLARSGMTLEKFKHILQKQMPDAEKRQRADFIIPSGLGKAYTQRYVSKLVHMLRDQPNI